MLIKKLPKEEVLKYRYADSSLRAKYKILNYILISILCLLTLLKAFWYILGYRILTENIGVKMLGWGVFAINTVMIILYILIIRLLFKFDARGYMALAALAIISITAETLDVVSIIVILITLFLSLFLKKKLFPNIPLLGYIPKQQ